MKIVLYAGLFLVLTIFGYFLILNSNLNNNALVKFSWCENCEGIRVGTTQCLGLRIKEITILKIQCRFNPI